MYLDGKIYVGYSNGEKICIEPKMANRHGLIAGATGTGKTTTLKVLAESFSDAGVPVFLADVKGDLSSMYKAGETASWMSERLKEIGMSEEEFKFQGYPVTFWDIYGKGGIQIRTTVSEMGPILLSRILGLNDVQSSLLGIVFAIADAENLLLIDTKDLKAMINHVAEHADEYAPDYGRISVVSLDVIIRNIVSLESKGGKDFFFEPALNVADFFNTDNGRGVINIMDSRSLMMDSTMYATFLLWLLSELFETLPEVGDLDKPRLVFFFDEAHLLFDDAPKAFVDKVVQVVKLIRSKGVGIFFISQNPQDIPDDVLGQLGNKIQHALRAYTPKDAKAIKAAAESYRTNPEFDTEKTIAALGTGEAIISFLEADGIPGMVKKCLILPPQSASGSITEEERQQKILTNNYYLKYKDPVDPESAYEFLQRQQKLADDTATAEAQKKAEEEAAAKEQAEKEKAEAKEQAEKEKAEAKEQAEKEKAEAKEKAAAEKAAEKERIAKEKAEAKEKAAKEKAEAKEKAAKEKAEAKEKEAKDKAMKKAAKSVGSSVTGTIGREVGKTIGDSIGGSFGKKIGGNLGASLGRSILGTLLK